MRAPDPLVVHVRHPNGLMILIAGVLIGAIIGAAAGSYFMGFVACR